ncbi:MarR family winged helix-turn-helix transcriptional regulator [uncultured Amnibacterium sp.]|uniref:MarR family winged helix-turn-helix transcriptional regulator n=1 Tax=uncultured Amnibacterium sp. TaxID=1631851 RepID=UPI0035CB30D0
MTGDELDANLTWSLVRTARFAGQRLSDRLAPHDLTPIQFGVLAHLSLAEEMTQAALARKVLIRPQSIAPLLSALEGRGLVVRTGRRLRGRRNPVRLTEAGRRVLDDVRDVALSANDLTDAGLTREESAQLNALLLKLISAIPPGDSGGDAQLWRA